MEQFELSDGVTPPFLITNSFRRIPLNCIALGLLFNPQRRRIMPKKCSNGSCCMWRVLMQSGPSSVLSNSEASAIVEWIVAVNPIMQVFLWLEETSFPLGNLRCLTNFNSSCRSFFFSSRFALVRGSLSPLALIFHEFKMSKSLLNYRQYSSVASLPAN